MEEYFKPGISGEEKDTFKKDLRAIGARYDDFDILNKNVKDREGKKIHEIHSFQDSGDLLDNISKNIQTTEREMDAVRTSLVEIQEMQKAFHDKKIALNVEIGKLLDQEKEEVFNKNYGLLKSIFTDENIKVKDFVSTLLRSVGFKKLTKNYFDQKNEFYRISNLKKEYEQKIADIRLKIEKIQAAIVAGTEEARGEYSKSLLPSDRARELFSTYEKLSNPKDGEIHLN